MDKKHKTNKPKFDYEDPKFYETIENLAKKGMTNEGIAWALEEEFGKQLNPITFSIFKNEKDENGEPTERNIQINKSLARGRHKINLLVRDVYLKTALGGKKTKDIVRVWAEKKCECRGLDMECEFCGGTGRIVSEKKSTIQEIEKELPPNIQALSTWLYNTDEEWREAVNEGKKLDLTTNGKDINTAIQVEVIDSRSQIDKDDENTDD